jgi:hypothetical protein
MRHSQAWIVSVRVRGNSFMREIVAAIPPAPPKIADAATLLPPTREEPYQATEKLQLL